jgi:hypothetical protein
MGPRVWQVRLDADGAQEGPLGNTGSPSTWMSPGRWARVWRSLCLQRLAGGGPCGNRASGPRLLLLMHHTDQGDGSPVGDLAGPEQRVVDASWRRLQHILLGAGSRLGTIQLVHSLKQSKQAIMLDRLVITGGLESAASSTSPQSRHGGCVFFSSWSWRFGLTPFDLAVGHAFDAPVPNS